MQLPQAGELRLVEVPVGDNGTEVLWAESIGGAERLVSVPVFAYGLSRDALISTKPSGHRARLSHVLHPSRGATIRCYVRQGVLASDIYRQRVIPSAQQMALRIGPATFLDPEIVAIHVHERKHVAAVTAY